MVDRIEGLPNLPGVSPSRGTPTVAQANPSAGAAIASAFDSVARGASEINRQLQPIFDQRAQEQAMDDVEASTETGREQGAVVTPDLRRAFTRQDQIYNQTVTQLVHARGMNWFYELLEEKSREHPLEPEIFDAAVQAARESYTADLDTPYRVELDAAMDRMSLDYRLRIQDRRRDSDAREALEQSELRKSTLLDEIHNMTRNGEVDSEAYAERVTEYTDIIDGMANNPLIEFTEADATRAVEQLEATQEYALAQNQIKALTDAGRYEDAFDLAGQLPGELGYGAEQSAGLTRDLRGFVAAERGQAERIRAETERAQSQAQTATYFGMRRAMLTGEQQLTFDDIDRAREGGRISAGHADSLYQQIASAQSSVGRLDEGYAQIRDFGGGDPRDSLHLEIADHGYQALLEDLSGGGEVTPQMRADAALAVIDEIGVVPPEEVMRTRIQSYSDDPITAAAAMQSISQLYEQGGEAVNVAYDGATLDRANAYTSLIAGGVPAEEAFALINASRDPENARRAEMFERDIPDLFDVEDGGIDAARAVERVFDRGFMQADPELGPPQNSAHAAAVYREVFTEKYRETGSAAAAQAFAESNVRRSFAVTRVFGERPQVMYLAPEMSPAYAVSGLDDSTEWMQRQLADAVLEHQGKTIEELIAADMPAAASYSRRDEFEREPTSPDRFVREITQAIQLIPDRRTAREFHSGGRPSYMVNYQDDDGAYQSFRFEFDPAPIREAARADIAAQAEAAAQRDAEVLGQMTRNRQGGVLGYVQGRPVINPNYEGPQ